MGNFRLSRERTGFVALTLGLLCGGISSKIFLDKSSELAEKFVLMRNEYLTSAADLRTNNESIRQQAEYYDNVLIYSSCGIIFGVACAGAGYTLMRMKPHEKWRPDLPRYTKVPRKTHL